MVKFLSKLVCILLIYSNSFGIGLGQMKVLSLLNEPLKVEIPVIHQNEQDIKKLSVKIASQDQYELLELARFGELDNLIVDVVKKDQTYFLSASIKEPVSSPILQLLLNISDGSGSYTKLYEVFLDPGNYESNPEIQTKIEKIVVEKKVTTSSPTPTPKPKLSPSLASKPKPSPSLASKPKPSLSLALIPKSSPSLTLRPKPSPLSAPKPKPSSPSSKPKNKHIVQKNDNLWNIVSGKEEYKGVTRSKIIKAISLTNDGVFKNGDINKIRPGQVIYLPSAREISSILSKSSTIALKPLVNKVERTAKAVNTSQKKVGKAAKVADTSQKKVEETAKVADTSQKEAEETAKVVKSSQKTVEKATKKLTKVARNADLDDWDVENFDTTNLKLNMSCFDYIPQKERISGFNTLMPFAEVAVEKKDMKNSDLSQNYDQDMAQLASSLFFTPKLYAKIPYRLEDQYHNNNPLLLKKADESLDLIVFQNPAFNKMLKSQISKNLNKKVVGPETQNKPKGLNNNISGLPQKDKPAKEFLDDASLNFEADNSKPIIIEMGNPNVYPKMTSGNTMIISLLALIMFGLLLLARSIINREKQKAVLIGKNNKSLSPQRRKRLFRTTQKLLKAGKKEEAYLVLEQNFSNNAVDLYCLNECYKFLEKHNVGEWINSLLKKGYDSDKEVDLKNNVPKKTLDLTQNAETYDLSCRNVSKRSSKKQKASDHLAEVSSSDIVSTKLNLAITLSSMGEKDQAKELLKDIMSQGNKEQKREAKAILKDM